MGRFAAAPLVPERTVPADTHNRVLNDNKSDKNIREVSVRIMNGKRLYAVMPSGSTKNWKMGRIKVIFQHANAAALHRQRDGKRRNEHGS